MDVDEKLSDWRRPVDVDVSGWEHDALKELVAVRCQRMMDEGFLDDLAGMIQYRGQERPSRRWVYQLGELVLVKDLRMWTAGRWTHVGIVSVIADVAAETHLLHCDTTGPSKERYVCPGGWIAKVEVAIQDYKAELAEAERQRLLRERRELLRRLRGSS